MLGRAALPLLQPPIACMRAPSGLRRIGKETEPALLRGGDGDEIGEDLGDRTRTEVTRSQDRSRTELANVAPEANAGDVARTAVAAAMPAPEVITTLGPTRPLGEKVCCGRVRPGVA